MRNINIEMQNFQEKKLEVPIQSTTTTTTVENKKSSKDTWKIVLVFIGIFLLILSLSNPAGFIHVISAILSFIKAEPVMAFIMFSCCVIAVSSVVVHGTDD